MIRAVIDTNVLISALLSSSGNEALVVLALAQGLLIACFSEEIMLEYIEVLSRPKFSFARDEISALERLIRGHGELATSIAIPQELPDRHLPDPHLPDPSDEKFLSCAIAASADFIVTGNKRHFPQNKCGRISVVNAAELLDFMTFNEA